MFALCVLMSFSLVSSDSRDDNLSRLECLLGEGGFGRVYKGRLENGQVAAIKQLDKNGLQGNIQFLVEVLMLSLLHHQNLVNLIGYCADGDQRLLVALKSCHIVAAMRSPLTEPADHRFLAIALSRIADRYRLRCRQSASVREIALSQCCLPTSVPVPAPDWNSDSVSVSGHHLAIALDDTILRIDGLGSCSALA
ncbi:hypothetical protein Scep_002588 [Stephania cephalantha]|uniref:Protein kinase domain-containing protein n=1 Tax=Stephania cephalantha TaxID=152367 RepID=A0AAP0LA66_9MAGN